MPAAVQLLGPRLRLEPFLESSLNPEYLGWLNDPEVTRFSNQRFRTHTAETARSYIASFAGTVNLLLAIRLADSGRMIGTITAYLSQPHRTADMGLMIGERACWGHGYGLEAWSSLMGHLLGPLGLRKVTGGCVRANVGMLTIMERSGMHLEAVRRRQEIVDGVEEDVLYFARFRDS
jgi:[ribosomal protein S5]-alanine N-acetyltransferase